MICRKDWAERSVCGDWSFHSEAEASVISEALLRQAKTVYDATTAAVPDLPGGHWELIVN